MHGLMNGKRELHYLDVEKAVRTTTGSEEAYVGLLTQFETSSFNESLLKISKMYNYRNWFDMARELTVLRQASLSLLSIAATDLVERSPPRSSLLLVNGLSAPSRS
eukprot:TRINITY_DN8633_c0_g1_i11.p1 TRINITY_DN8633_c0_g1~~TRINITY_DN8633_c0_g1_i11.p1  ORF type:complete len:106 (+),score=8.47 TRINITY_DN8633_c0_g1_i11:64-381(+)